MRSPVILEYDYYISGPMTGMPNYNREAFNEVERRILEDEPEASIFNPGRSDDDHLPWEDCLRYDLEALVKSHNVIVLPGWQDSPGARLEVYVANQLKIPVVNTDFSPVDIEEGLDAAELAHTLTNGDRQKFYGHPLDDFTRTARMWSIILGVEVEPDHVAMCMIALKISRQLYRPKRDNVVDMAGYANTLDMLIRERERRAGVSSSLVQLAIREAFESTAGCTCSKSASNGCACGDRPT